MCWNHFCWSQNATLEFTFPFSSFGLISFSFSFPFLDVSFFIYISYISNRQKSFKYRKKNTQKRGSAPHLHMFILNTALVPLKSFSSFFVSYKTFSSFFSCMFVCITANNLTTHFPTHCLLKRFLVQLVFKWSRLTLQVSQLENSLAWLTRQERWHYYIQTKAFRN